MFRALLALPQEALHKRHLVYCVRVMSVGCTRIEVTSTGTWRRRLYVSYLKYDVITRLITIFFKKKIYSTKFYNFYILRLYQNFIRKGQAIPIHAYYRPRSFHLVEAPRLRLNWHMKIIRLSALWTGHLYHPGNISGTHLFQRLTWPQGHRAAGRIMSMILMPSVHRSHLLQHPQILLQIADYDTD
jgi:hypothetical protein